MFPSVPKTTSNMMILKIVWCLFFPFLHIIVNLLLYFDIIIMLPVLYLLFKSFESRFISEMKNYKGNRMKMLLLDVISDLNACVGKKEKMNFTSKKCPL